MSALTAVPAPVAGIPAYSESCEAKGNHSLDHLAGYDVIVTLSEGAKTRATIASSIEGGNQYAAALEVMHGIRAGAQAEGGYAYTAQAWTCGCRQAGRVARTSGVEFIPSA